MLRREFLSTAAALAANNTVRVGLIGCGGRGRYVARLMREAPGVEFVAAADVYLPKAAAAQEWMGAQAEAYQDFRRVLERKDVDAVLVATPDHWHAGATVLACEAGKDVYVEKPLAHNIREGREMVKAARRFNRVVQTGTQQRSASHFAEITRMIQAGELGTVNFVRVWNYVNMAPTGIGRVADSAPPAGLDWDFYVGPAPSVPFNAKRFGPTFRWFRDYAGGYITDYGTHRFDTVQQIMGVTAPRSVAATGNRFRIKDAGDIPDVLQVTYEYDTFVLSYESCLLNSHGVGGRSPGMRYYNARGEDDRPNGMAFYGTNGTIIADRIGYEVFPDGKPEGRAPERRRMNTTDATKEHAANFVDCVRSRARPAADVETGHRSTTVPLLGNLAYDVGRKLRWDPGREEVIGDSEASSRLGRPARQPWDQLRG